MSPLHLLLVTALSIVLLLVLVMRLKVHAFIALLLVSAGLGLATGMPPMKVVKSIQDGMGGVLGFIAVVVGIGSIFGEILQASGGAEALSRSLLAKFGETRASWAMMTTGFIIAIPIFFDVGFIILVPMIYALSRKTGRSTLYYAIPLLAGLAVAHAFIPPTPGPIAVAEIVKAQLGWVILFGIVAGFPTAVVAGPLFGRYIARRIVVHPPPIAEDAAAAPAARRPPPHLTAWVLILIGLPLVLIVGASVAEALIRVGWMADGAAAQAIRFVGHPFIALLLATLLTAYMLGIRMGFSGAEVMRISDRALAPAGLIILVTGAGGVFKQILVDSGVGAAIAELVKSHSLPPVVLAYVLAAIVRVTQGSATVAMITAAGMVAPMLDAFGTGEIGRALVVLSVAAGATIFSHVNDSGFWLVGKYLGLTEKQTLQSWSIMESIVSATGFAIVLMLSLVFR